MRCLETEKTYNATARRDVITCHKFADADRAGAEPTDRPLGSFQFLPKGLHWGWGVGAGAVASVVAAQSAIVLVSETTDSERATLAAEVGIGVPAVIGGIMAIFKATRTAGFAMIGSGLVTGIIQAVLANGGHYFMSLTTVPSTTSGAIVAAQPMAGAPVQVMGGVTQGPMGLISAKTGLGAAAPAAGPPEVARGAFGSGIGTPTL